MNIATYADKHTEVAHARGPISGDATVRQYGIDGRTTGIRLWRMRGVKPKRATTGIRAGDTITTWQGTGMVTRVGTIAGFYILNGTETRWTIESVTSITPR